MSLLLLLGIIAGSAWADQPPSEDGVVPNSESVIAAIEDGSELNDATLTDPAAAVGLPLAGLDRDQAGELLAGVFGDVVEAPGGIYDGLQDARVLGPNVAVLPDADAPKGPIDAEPEIESTGDMPPATPGELSGSGLISSTVPLLVEGGDQTPVPVDLTLEDTGASLQPSAPLVDVQIPKELGDGIKLPDLGITVKLDDAPEQRAGSIVEGNAAFYPNVAENSDFAVSPAPSGFETFSQLRDEDSPATQVYRLELPEGAVLAATEDGGAVVKTGDEKLLAVQPPAAIDTAGEQVPVNLTVEGNFLSLHADPAPGAQYPILIDPLWQTYEWATKNTSGGICSNSITPQSENSCNNREEWGYEVSAGNGWPPHIDVYDHKYGPPYTPGIGVHAGGSQIGGSRGAVVYTVPRYFKQNPPPTSFIKTLKVSNMRWEALGSSASPYAFMGIWDYVNKGWIENWSHSGQVEYGVNDPAWVYEFSNKQPNLNGKFAQVGIWATESTSDSYANLYVGAASVELGDNDVPQQPVPTAQTKWVNQTAPPLQFSAGDTGLGVFAISASTEELGTNGQPLYTWKAANGCIGVGDSACPQTWTSTQAKQPLTYDPKVLSTGIKYLRLVAEDPVGNKSSGSWEEVRIDHTAPAIGFGGSITEQEQLGTRRATYNLKAYGADGDAEYPQSGIAKAEVKLDGTTIPMEGAKLAEWSPNCATQNCPLSAEWTLDSSSVAAGKHTVQVIATDAVGLSTTKTLTIETQTASPPTLALSGSMTEQASLGTSRPRYVLKAKSTATAAGFEAPNLGTPAAYAVTLGGAGKEVTGGFYEPADTATDSKGNVWVVDSQTRVANQLQEFNEKGEWLRSTGSSGYGKLKTPWGVAVDAGNNVWVADTGNNRIVEFNEKGEFLQTFGTNVNKTKVEAGGTEAEKNLCTAASGNVCQAATAGSLAGQLKSPQGIALTSGGNIWVADTGNNRVQKFGPTGNMINNISGEGTEPGKLKMPTAITVAPDNSIWVADFSNNRIQQWNSSLTFVRAVGTKGTDAGEFKNPSGIEADSTGAIWVSDFGNGRVQEFDESGTFLQKFNDAAGAAGTPRGLAIDAKGSLWVADQYAFRVYRWTIPGFPVYTSSIGSSGSGNGQFTEPVDVAADNAGNFWVLDSGQNRLQEFDATGKWLRNAGAAGTGTGKLSLPRSLSTDTKNNVWVADTGNNRVVEFNEKGEFVLTFGTNVNKTKVEAGGTEAEKNLCTAASGNVCQAATAGSLSGQLKSPKGIALTSGGNIWVADTGNSRIEKFGPTGNMLNNISGLGTEPGKLREPTGISIAPDGSIWVADTGNNRIEQWNSSLIFLRAIGKEGSGGGEFKSPLAIEADSSGNVWVGDQKNNRVEEFGEGGKYLGQFGANGSGKFSFSTAAGVAVDASGSIWVADPGHFKVQKWIQEVPRSEITTTIWFDGVQKNSLRASCKTSSCTIEPEWTLDASAYEVGSHSARVKTTDGLGRSSESTLSIQIAKDTVKPTLAATGALFNAPEGWVEQDAYGLSVTASDGGYGATSLALMIDGKQVASASQSCTTGGCPLTLTQQVNMAMYAGGSHPAEVIATDGAGNKASTKWEINVDPQGHISTQEATDTLEALEHTSDANVVGAPQTEEEIEGTFPGAGTVKAGEAYKAIGTAVPSTVPVDPDEGFTMSVAEGGLFGEHSCTGLPPQNEEDPIEIETCEPGQHGGFGSGPDAVPLTVTPVNVSSESGNYTGVDGNATLAQNTRPNVDTVLRPLYEGILSFQQIRDASAPEDFSWQIDLQEGMYVKAAGQDAAEVFYQNGHPAFTVSVVEAHDAVGTTVPTDLSVETNGVITLHVHHKAQSFVYPVIAGSGWQGGYISTEIKGPMDEKETREAAEKAARELHEQLEQGAEITEEYASEYVYRSTFLWVKTSVVSGPIASASSDKFPPHWVEVSFCLYPGIEIPNVEYPPPPEAPHRDNTSAGRSVLGSCVEKDSRDDLLAAIAAGGYFHWINGKKVWHNVNEYFDCPKIGEHQPAKVNCGVQPKESKTGITLRGDFKWPADIYHVPGPICETIYGHVNSSVPHKEVKEEIWGQLYNAGEKCDWPSWPS